MKKRMKTRTIIMAGLGTLGLVAAGVAVSKRLKSPITSITWSSTQPGKLDIAWYDDEKNVIYKIYWSNRKGIRVKDPTTYLHYVQVTTLSQMGESMHHKATISLKEEWVYIVITKKGYISSEFEAKIEQYKGFSIANLNVEILKKLDEKEDVNILLTVLDRAETYRISLYLPDGKCIKYDFDVKNMKTVNLKFPSASDALVYIEAKISNIWSMPEFLFLLCEFLISAS
jgi:hypothetical protein